MPQKQLSDTKAALLAEAAGMLARSSGIETAVRAERFGVPEGLELDTVLSWSRALGSGQTVKALEEADASAQALHIFRSRRALYATGRWMEAHNIHSLMAEMVSSISQIRSHWHSGGKPSLAAVRLLAFLSISPFAPDGPSACNRLASVMGIASAETSGLIRKVTHACLLGDLNTLKKADLVLRSYPRVESWLGMFIDSMARFAAPSAEHSKQPALELQYPPLAGILADMVRSALEWERRHGRP